MNLWHVTLSENLNSIIKTGILLKYYGSGGCASYPELITPGAAKIYLTSNPEELSALDDDFSTRFWDIAMIEVNVDGLELTQDPEYSSGDFANKVWYTTVDIPPERIISHKLKTCSKKRR